MTKRILAIRGSLAGLPFGEQFSRAMLPQLPRTLLALRRTVTNADQGQTTGARNVSAGWTVAGMAQRLRPDGIQNGLLKELVNCRNKAEQLRAAAEDAQGEARRLYYDIAASFDHSAQLIERLKRVVGSKP